MSSEPKQWKPFEEGPLTIEQRFADNPKGRARQDRVWELYVQQDNVACPLFDSTGREVFKRHPLNNRNENSHRQASKRTLVQYGFAKGVRGSPWVIVRRRASSTDIFVPVAGSAMDCNNYEPLMMTSATLIEALYEAVTDWLSENAPGKTSLVDLSPAEKEKFDSTQVGRSVSEGVANVTIFNERTPSDVLDWLRDWGNLFNRAASKVSFVEHLQSLSKIEPALASHLDSHVPPITSSHSEYEKVVKKFVDDVFPDRFASYREFQAASMFRKRMLEHSLWDQFLEWCNSNVNFEKAAEIEPGTIYKLGNAISRKFLQHAKPTKVNAVSTDQVKQYGWASIAMSVLKFMLPTTPVALPSLPPELGGAWSPPHLLTKATDVEKVDVFFSIMANTKASQLPQINREQKEKALEKRAEKEAKAKAKGKAKATAKAKASAKRKRGDDSDDEPFAEQIADEHGNVRMTLFGDDLVNAVNFTLEKIPSRSHRSQCVGHAFDLATLFALDSKLDLAGTPRHQVWTKARKFIKSYLNKTHALRARQSDPDEPLGHGQLEENEMDDDEPDESADACQRLAIALRVCCDKGLQSFMEDNFPDFSLALIEPRGDSNGAGSGCDDDTNKIATALLPTLSSALETHPALLLMVNKVKKSIRQGGAAKHLVSATLDMKAKLHEVFKVVAKCLCDAFDPSYMDFAVGVLEVMGFLRTTSWSKILESLSQNPSVAKGKLKTLLLTFGDSDSEFQAKLIAFMSHRAVYMLGGLQAASDELEKSDNPDVKNISVDLAHAVAVLRQMLQHVGAADGDFAEQHCWVTADKDELKSKYIEEFVCLWERLVMAVVNLKGNTLKRRSDEQWQEFASQEAKKFVKKNVKEISSLLCKGGLDELQKNKGILAAEVVRALEEALADQPTPSQNTKNSREHSLQDSLQKLKKDALAQSLAALQVQREKQTEIECWEQWQANVRNLISKADGPAAGDDLIVSPAAGLDEHDAVFVRLDSPSLQRSQHWEAQRLAAAATWVLLGSYAGSGAESLIANQEALEVSGLDNFRDNFNGMVGVQKKKLVIQLTQLAPDDLKDIRLCFSGRFVPAPHGQPPTFLKTKLKVESSYFANLGYDIFLVPVSAQQNISVAMKSPLCCAAWMVKPSTAAEEVANLNFEYHNMTLKFGDVLVDLRVPTLCVNQRAVETVIQNRQASKGKSKGADATASLPLCRPLTADEETILQEKGDAKKARDAKRKQRAATLAREDLDDDGADTQLAVEASLFKHLLK